MTIEKKLQDDKMTVFLSGRLDTTTAPLLEEEIKASLDAITDLTLDLTGLEYISSAGLRVLLSTQKAMNKRGEMRVKGVSEIVMEIFDITGFTDILTIE